MFGLAMVMCYHVQMNVLSTSVKWDSFLSPFLTVWCMYFILSVTFLQVIRNRA